MFTRNAILAFIGVSSMLTGCTEGVEDTLQYEPQFARIDFSDGRYCSATLVSPNKILTAAHCIFDETEAVSVFFGDGTERRATLSNIERSYDIAAMELDTPVDYEPVAVDTSDTLQDYTGEEIEMRGWGCDKHAPLYRKGSMTKHDRAMYTLSLPYASSFTLWGISTTDFSYCKGDSGAAVFSITRGKIIGVLSGGPKGYTVISDINKYNMESKTNEENK